MHTKIPITQHSPARGLFAQTNNPLPMFLATAIACVCFVFVPFQSTRAVDFQQTIRTAQSKIVKIYGAGGLRQFEAYQTGILISPEGHILTVLSYVLDTDDLAVILDDGRKWPAQLLGSDPMTELALLKLPDEAQQLPYFEVHREVPRATPGQRILALSNLYGIATGDEPVSVLQGVVTAIAPLRARRGAYQANYRDQVYVLDAAANNPGAAGGALIDWQGRLLGVLGKELRSEMTGTWLNYALPTSSFLTKLDDLRKGSVVRASAELPPPEQPHSTEALGLRLIPNVLPRTPPYIDTLRHNSPAERAGLRPDDLIVFVADEPTDSHRSVVKQISAQRRSDPLTISVLRQGNLRQFTLVATEPPTQVTSETTAQSDDDNETP